MTIQDARREYEGEVIQLFANIARPPRSTISDEQYNTEIALARRLLKAISETFAAITAINDDSGFMRVDAQSFKDWVHDECPDPGAVDEKLTMARRGYETASGSLK